MQCDFPPGLHVTICVWRSLSCSAHSAEIKPVYSYPTVLESFPSHLHETELRGWRCGAGRGGVVRPSQSHTAMRTTTGLWFGSLYPRSSPDSVPVGLGSPGILPMSQQAACSAVIRQLVGSRAISFPPKSSRKVRVLRRLWRCVHVSCFAFPLSSWQALHFQSTHWVNFSSFKAVLG